MTNIEKATQIIEQEGYYVKHNMSVFSIFETREYEADDVKSVIRLNSRVKYNPDRSMTISFAVGIQKMAQYDLPIETNRAIAKYLLHLCDVADELNNLHIYVKDLSELGINK